MERDVVRLVEYISTVTLTDNDNDTVNVQFNQNSRGVGFTDGILSIIAYPKVTSGTAGTFVLKVRPTDRHSKTPQNVSDHEQELFNGAFVSQTKGTNGGYMFAINDLPKCFGLEFYVEHAGTAVVEVSLVTLF